MSGSPSSPPLQMNDTPGRSTFAQLIRDTPLGRASRKPGPRGTRRSSKENRKNKQVTIREKIATGKSRFRRWDAALSLDGTCGDPAKPWDDRLI